MRLRGKQFKLCLCFVLSMSLVLQTGCGTNPLVSPKTTFDESPSSEETYKESPLPEDEPDVTVPHVFVEPEYLEEYSSVLRGYQEFYDFLIAYDPKSTDVIIPVNVLGTSTTDDVVLYDLYCMMAEVNLLLNHLSQYNPRIPKTQDAIGYAFKDLNGDGNPELILLLQNYTVLAIYTISDCQPKLLDAYWPRHCCGIDSSGLIYVNSNSSAWACSFSTYQVSPDGSSMLLISEFGVEVDGSPADAFDYQIVDGEKQTISQAEYDDLFSKFPSRINNDYGCPLDITKDSGIEFIPLYD